MSGNPRAWSDEYWESFITDCRRVNAPVYERLTDGIRHDDELRGLASLAQLGQPPANLILGAVHFLLLRGAEHPLRRHYHSLTDDEAPHEDPFPLFRDFCLQHRDVIAELIATRITNTNEVGRCVFLLPAFLTLAKDAPAPLHIIELGASAGLNLFWDRYGCRYLRDDEVYRSGAPNASIILDARLTGAVPPLGAGPGVGFRAGIEKHPVDLSDGSARDWLRALVWPDHPQRLKRLERALAYAVQHPPPIRPGDALELLLDLAAEAPRDGTLCIVHTMVTYQFSRAQRASLKDLLTVIGLRRPVWRLSMEWYDNGFPVLLSRYADGAKTERLLALTDGHGNILDWRG